MSAALNHPHFEEFLAQAVSEDPEIDPGLNPDELYGLYTSWCLLHKEEPQTPGALWDALEAHHIGLEHNHLVMRGPAAVDYILASAPNLV